MHPTQPGNIGLQRALGAILCAALTVFAASCDRDLPTQPTGGEQITATTDGTTTFSARATALRSTVLGATVATCSAGPLPPQGGEDGEALLIAGIGSTVSASTLHSVVLGHGDRCGAVSTTADVTIKVAGQTILCCLAMSTVQAICVAGTATVQGASQVADLRINGQTTVVTGQPNQTVWLPLGLGRIVVNEQIRSGTTLTVRALRVVAAGSADVVVSESTAGISCGEVVCDGPKDFVTGGGWITGTPSGAKGTFGLSGGIKNGAFWGHLTYVDHGPGGPRVKGTGVTAYSVTGPTSRHIEGTCEINGQGGYRYMVDVADNGEPGRSDTFRVQLSNGYFANGTLQGGNIQLHTACQ